MQQQIRLLNPTLFQKSHGNQGGSKLLEEFSKAALANAGLNSKTLKEGVTGPHRQLFEAVPVVKVKAPRASSILAEDGYSDTGDRTVDTSNEDIFESACTDPNSQLVETYGANILLTIFRTEQENSTGIERHEIKGRHRRQMIDWMREILEVFKSPAETFYLSVTILDRYLDQKKATLELSELHEIGVTSLFIASKQSEIEPLTLDLMHKKAAHGKISEDQIKRRERDILNTLKFRTSVPTL